MREYFSKSMFKQEFKKIKWFSPILFLILLLVFNNNEMLTVAKKGVNVGFSASYAIKNYISLSWINMILLALVYTLSCTILMSNKAKYLQSEEFQGSKRISYFITEGIFLLTALGISFMGNYLLKILAYISNRKIFYGMANIDFSYFLKFLMFHLIFIILMVSINLFLHSILGKPYSVVIMPMLVIYSYLLFFGTGYFLLSENHTKAREFIKWVDNSTIYKLYGMINTDYRLALQNNNLQFSVMTFMLIAAVITLGLGVISYRYMKPERLNRYFMYSGVEIVVMGFIFTACALYLGILTSVIMLVRNDKLDMMGAWDYSYKLMFIYIAIAATVRIVYAIIRKRPWEIYMKKKEKGNIDIQA